MALVSRLGGSLLVKSSSRYFIVGELKRPVDWSAEGYQPPAHLSAGQEDDCQRLPWFEVSGCPAPGHEVCISLGGAHDSHTLCDELHKRLTIRRNGSVSERLWDLVMDHSRSTAEGHIDGTWLVDTPMAVWDMVRESMLRCS